MARTLIEHKLLLNDRGVCFHRFSVVGSFADGYVNYGEVQDLRYSKAWQG